MDISTFAIILVAVMAYPSRSFADNVHQTHSHAAQQLAQNPEMQTNGCCAIRNTIGGNVFDWTDNITRANCIQSARDIGAGIHDWYHYPNETCTSVKRRCSANPC
jgi:hypothetical protein